MKAGFLTSEQVFSERGLGLFARIDALAKATDFALALSDDDGFFVEGGSYVNYYLQGGRAVSRFGKAEKCELCAVRPAILLEPEETAQLQNLREENESLREMAEHDLPAGALAASGKTYTLPGGKTAAEYLMNGKKLIAVPVSTNLTLGFLQLSSGLCRTYGEPVTLEARPVTWYYDAAAQLLIAKDAITAGFSYEEAAAYLAGDFLKELRATEVEEAEAYPFRYEEHDELDIVRAYLKADIPVFLHGLSGDGKSDRVRQIDPQALDIELVNENPESINGKTIYNEAKDEIREIKPVWLVHLEKLCEDGKPHVLFFDELTNATKHRRRQRPGGVDREPRSGRAAFRAFRARLHPHDGGKLDAVGGEKQAQSLCAGVSGEQRPLSPHALHRHGAERRPAPLGAGLARAGQLGQRLCAPARDRGQRTRGRVSQVLQGAAAADGARQLHRRGACAVQHGAEISDRAAVPESRPGKAQRGEGDGGTARLRVPRVV